MKKFIVTINAYDYYAKFEVSSNDDPISLEQAIVDKLGENVIKWEYVGANVFATDKYRITYEEVINDDATAHPGSLQAEGDTGPKMEARAS
jgi:hypothetical protein